MLKHRLQFQIARQPDETTCGPTCLEAIYRYYNDALPLDQLIREVPSLDDGGTLGVLLACHALRRGYRAALYPYNLQLFDPTWFDLDRHALESKLRSQAEHKERSKLRFATAAFLEFLELGGELRFADLSPRLIRRLLGHDQPLLTGLSATYLYRTPREFGPEADYDDVRGEPSGHFVVLCGFEPRSQRVLVADPLHPNPFAETQLYAVNVDRLITAILLGVLTYDAVLLLLEPSRRRPG